MEQEVEIVILAFKTKQTDAILQSNKNTTHGTRGLHTLHMKQEVNNIVIHKEANKTNG